MHAARSASTTLDTGAGQFSFSETGSLVYVPGGSYPELRRSFVWVDRGGKAEPLPLPPGAYSAPRLSPDGRQIAYVVGRRTGRDLWVYDTENGTSRRLTFDESSEGAVWSPDGATLAFPADGGGGVPNLYSIAADGSAGPERLTTSDHAQWVSSWSSRGILAFVEGIHDIRVLSMPDGREPETVLDTPFNEQWPAFSPGGEWLAYVTNETGQDEVYVRPYGGPGPITRVSIDGGWSPVWSRDGTELFYRDDGQMLVADVTPGTPFAHARPRVLFDAASYLASNPTPAYDVAPDGRFLMVTRTELAPQPATRIHVVLNWFEDLQARLSANR
jgi:dipeptidyl aminopeptidase/acylaminoacyl peptidase